MFGGETSKHVKKKTPEHAEKHGKEFKRETPVNQTSITIPSSFSNCIDIFDNDDSFPDLEFVIPGLENPLKLHRIQLGRASEVLGAMLRAKISMYGVFDGNSRRIEWTYERAASDDKYRNILVKWLRFCYGEDQTFEIDECVTALVTLMQLEIEKRHETMAQLERFIIESAMNDLGIGVKIIEECCNAQQEFHNEDMIKMSERLVKCVMTRDNIEKNKGIMIDCMMKLPKDYLDFVEYGEIHSETSEFNLRMRYVRYNKMNEEEQSEIIGRCDPNVFDGEELIELHKLGLISSEKLIENLGRVIRKKEEECKRKDDEIEAKKREIEEERQNNKQVRLAIRKKEEECKRKDDEIEAKKREIEQERRKKEEEGKRTEELRIKCTIMQEFLQRIIDVCSSSMYSNNAVANGILGDCYFCGNGVEQDKTKALEYWKRASSITEMTDVYSFLSTCDNNRLRKTAPDGNGSEALNDLATCYKYGSGVMKDEHKAYELFYRASTMNNARALFSVGRCLAFGEGINEDKKKAIQFYVRAAKMGDANAMTNLGCYYQDGTGIPQDKKKAVQLYEHASSLGSGCAMYNLATCYLNGYGVEQNKKKAIELEERASKLDFSYATMSLADRYNFGNGVPQDKKKALVLYQRASELGNPSAMNTMGLYYMIGQEVPQNKKKAVELFQRASKMGNADAMDSLALCYDTGDGVRQDEKKAFELYKRASDMGSFNAMKNLGVCYYKGQGVKQDKAEGIRLIKRASELGSSEAKEILEELGI